MLLSEPYRLELASNLVPVLSLTMMHRKWGRTGSITCLEKNQKFKENLYGDHSIFFPSFKSHCSCWRPELLPLQMPILATEWDSVFPFVHKSYVVGRGLPVWPMKVNVEHAASWCSVYLFDCGWRNDSASSSKYTSVRCQWLICWKLKWWKRSWPNLMYWRDEEAAQNMSG